MKDPYLRLGVAEDADDATIHAAYLAAIQACPPDRDPEHFAAIRQAYETIKTQRDRLAFELFDKAPPDHEDLLERAYPRTAPQPPAMTLVQALLRGEV